MNNYEIEYLQRRRNKEAEDLLGCVKELYEKRKEAIKQIQIVRNYVSQLKNCPSRVSEIIEYAYENTKDFRNAMFWEIEENHSSVNSDHTVISEIGTPLETMSIATTLGISGSQAISTLGSKMAVKTALSWLGGGALATAGTGMGLAASSIVLGLIGPIGLGIAGVATILGRQQTQSKEKEKKEAQEALDKLILRKVKLKKLKTGTDNYIKLLKNVDTLLNHTDFDDKEYPKEELYKLADGVLTISKSINETISTYN